MPGDDSLYRGQASLRVHVNRQVGRRTGVGGIGLEQRIIGLFRDHCDLAGWPPPPDLPAQGQAAILWQVRAEDD